VRTGGTWCVYRHVSWTRLQGFAHFQRAVRHLPQLAVSSIAAADYTTSTSSASALPSSSVSIVQ
jgi:hypothetical protein